uniref:DUF4283 domain-containing protein n=1 Tax=Populus trichocarpa TaxID=3694 RepID=A0A2K1XY34_POPTR
MHQPRSSAPSAFSPCDNKGVFSDDSRASASANTERAGSFPPIPELHQGLTHRSTPMQRGTPTQPSGFVPTSTRATSSPSLNIPVRAQTNTKESQQGTSQSPGLVHFPDFASSVSCQFKDTDVASPADLWKFCLIGFVVGKFPGYASLSHYIDRNWKHHANFTMHDFGWLIFAFPTEHEMLEVLGGGPYYVFGRPLILKVIPDFFDFKPNDTTKMPTWVRFPNLRLRCRTSLCLSKLASVTGKPIHCDDPTTNMTRLSYAWVLIEVNLPGDLPSSVNVVLPNGSNIAQQVLYESLPRFCKSCLSWGTLKMHVTKGESKCKTRPQDIHEDSSSPSADTVTVEKQQPYSQGAPVDTHVDPMSTEVVTFETKRHSSPGRKRTKLAAPSNPKQALDTGKCEEALLVKRQYLTRSKESKKDAQPSLGKPGSSKGPVPVHYSSDDSAPSLSM